MSTMPATNIEREAIELGISRILPGANVEIFGHQDGSIEIEITVPSDYRRRIKTMEEFDAWVIEAKALR